MTFFHLAILALVQGVTEFLPVSSSGHLVLVPALTGWADQGLIIDVAVHVGTLGAVMVYFWRDLWEMTAGIGRLATGRRDAGAKQAGYLIIATLPLIAAGYYVNLHYAQLLRDPKIIAWATLGFGLVLYLTDRIGMTMRRMEHLGLPDALVIGLAQVLALIPGTSRSGITMSAARLMGFERGDAARFSLLLSIPAIIGAGTLKGWELVQAGDAQLTTDALLAALLAFTAALVSIAALMAWLRRATFTPFVLYRMVLGIFLLAFTYGFFPISGP